MSRLYAREICAGAAVRDLCVARVPAREHKRWHVARVPAREHKRWHVARVPAREHIRWQTLTRFHDLDTDTHRNMVADSDPDVRTR